MEAAMQCSFTGGTLKMADGFSQQIPLSVCFKSIVRSQYE